jgi:oxygen-independent coproporphyrinogen-3 oxidase
VYIGGGTPTVLDGGVLDGLAAWVGSILRPGAGREWSVEANPGSAGLGQLSRLRLAGVNRISIGAQAFDARRLAILGRRHSVEQTIDAVAAARDAGFDNAGLDLIAGGPGCGSRAWRRSLDRAVALGPEHVSVYALTVEEGTALAEAVRLRKTRLSDPAIVERLHEAQRVLEAAGYVRYEISNYARPGYACRHNLACWRGERYLGVGPAAASHVGLVRWTNVPDVREYVERLEAGLEPVRETDRLSLRTKAAERLVFGLRMAEGVDLDDALSEGGEPGLREQWEKTLSGFEARGLARRAGSRWSLTPKGMDFADAIAVDLL